MADLDLRFGRPPKGEIHRYSDRDGTVTPQVRTVTGSVTHRYGVTVARPESRSITVGVTVLTCMVTVVTGV